MTIHPVRVVSFSLLALAMSWGCRLAPGREAAAETMDAAHKLRRMFDTLTAAHQFTHCACQCRNTRCERTVIDADCSIPRADGCIVDEASQCDTYAAK